LIKYLVAWEGLIMKHLNVVRQTQVENRMLQFLIDGLRNTLQWRIEGEDVSRKLSTLKFITRSFRSHLERLLDLKERGGYMDIAIEKQPQLSKTVENLRHEHDEFRQAIRAYADDLDRASPTDQNTLAGICERGEILLKKVDAHNKEETDLLQEALEREDGGEG
jgi:hemerythrin-like domain-containing protein